MNLYIYICKYFNRNADPRFWRWRGSWRHWASSSMSETLARSEPLALKQMVQCLGPESQGQNLFLAVLYVPSTRDSGLSLWPGTGCRRASTSTLINVGNLGQVRDLSISWHEPQHMLAWTSACLSMDPSIS